MDDDILVMEPADDRKKDHSHFAHKIKQNPMKFEDSSGMALWLHVYSATVYSQTTSLCFMYLLQITLIYVSYLLATKFHTTYSIPST